MRTQRKGCVGRGSFRSLGECVRRQTALLSITALVGVTACGSESKDHDSGGSPVVVGGAGSTAASSGGAATSSGGVSSAATGGASSVVTTSTGGQNTSSGGVTGASGGSMGAGGTSSVAGAAGSGGAGGSSGGNGGGGGASGTAGGGGGTGCTRDALKSAIDAYYAAMAAHDPTKAPLASSVKLTENGKTMMVGDGLWKTAGMVKFKRSALDTTICSSATESVLPESSTDRIFGVRLKLENQQITEIETIVVRSGDYILNNPPGLAMSSNDDWETVLPADQQPTRDSLQKFMDDYLTKFPAGACNFASDCTRLEDGGSVGKCEDGTIVSCNPNATAGAAGMKARLHIIDEQAGISVGFTMFAGTYTDFHLFKVRMGMVHGVHAVLAKASSPGW